MPRSVRYSSVVFFSQICNLANPYPYLRHNETVISQTECFNNFAPHHFRRNRARFPAKTRRTVRAYRLRVEVVRFQGVSPMLTANITRASPRRGLPKEEWLRWGPFNNPPSLNPASLDLCASPGSGGSEWKLKYLMLLSRNYIFGFLGVLSIFLTGFCAMLQQVVPQVYG